ncbi:hypothetical protein FSARC_9795 [Fusarium sarcochroum]|uniref:Uncharacterized protein n=1 Tax=Fusarium sarcochroum TaxID=1208366 RepID=A0A8H4TQ74_9HYPO|nr:hypothetical protein FSARC_9795 [Fusarium sarcochroum]
MEGDIPGRFTIIVDGRPVANPHENGERVFQAQSGVENSDAAVFELHDGHLVSGDWALGRYRIEDMSLQPKRILWCKREESNELQPVQVEHHGNGPELKFSGGSLVFLDNRLFVPLIDEGLNQRVEIRPLLF